jgi:hypothetical protein
MEIGPIPGIRAVPAIKAGRAGLQPPTIFDVDSSARPGDGNGQGNVRKAAGAEENDENDFTPGMESKPEDEEQDDLAKQKVDYFA